MLSYGQYCGLARALDVVSGRWSLLIVRELAAGPARYGNSRPPCPGSPPTCWPSAASYGSNLAKRALRHVKVHLKISGCFRTLATTGAHCRIHSYLITTGLHRRPADAGDPRRPGRQRLETPANRHHSKLSGRSKVMM